MYYTKEQIELAKSCDLIDLLKRNGYELKRENRAYKVINVDGGLYIFTKNEESTQGFYWHKYNLKGNAIDFCKSFFNDTYLEAIERLLKQSNNEHKNNDYGNYKKKLDNEKEKIFVMPERDKSIKNAYAYLIETRKIEKELLNRCIEKKLIRQFNINGYTNVGFIGYDKNDNAKYLMLRTTNTNLKYRAEYTNSSKKYGFKIFDKKEIENNEIKRIFIFESPIDLMSYITINKLDTKNNIFLSMGGTSDLCLKQFLEDYKVEVVFIKVCFDNDEAGENGYKKIENEYGEKYKILRDRPNLKDFNDDLKSKKI